MRYSSMSNNVAHAIIVALICLAALLAPVRCCALLRATAYRRIGDALAFLFFVVCCDQLWTQSGWYVFILGILIYLGSLAKTRL